MITIEERDNMIKETEEGMNEIVQEYMKNKFSHIPMHLYGENLPSRFIIKDRFFMGVEEPFTEEVLQKEMEAVAEKIKFIVHAYTGECSFIKFPRLQVTDYDGDKIGRRISCAIYVH